MAAGVYSDGYCYSDASAALTSWCFQIEPGSTFSSCQMNTGIPQISFINNTGTLQTSSYTPALPVCDTDTDNLNPIPMGFALSGAVVLVWVGIWGFNQVRNVLRQD